MRPIFAIALLLSAVCVRGQNEPPAAWKKLDFLIGKWAGVAGENETPLGPGQGAFSFEAELNRKIIMRRNTAAYDSGVKHDDLMVIYLDAPNDTPRAIYFDTEGHVIRYNLTFPAAGRVLFESDGTQAGPSYRLTYWLEDGILKGRFEVGSPGSEYKTYMSWSSKRR
ncbi:MAG TPA: hypothetical protein VMJ75_29000 [Candidatus Acidoferrales bacterium]|nr:hypothetical protein [Candidatus Acidoferrales bacterium]